jgi:signal transduction histidine kinase
LLLNLVDNAFKSHEQGGLVPFALRRETDSAILRISNTGAGIPPEVLPRVFDRLFRGDPSRARDVVGCGLGLSIARSIVTAHGGEIEIASERDHETVVTVRLPVLKNGSALPTVGVPA